MARGARSYQAIQGSSRLATAPLAAEPALARVEALAAGDMRRVPYAGELIGGARPHGRCAAIPLEAFDAAGARLEPEEQGAYFQLLRLSYAEGRNFCRVPKRDLVARLGTSERRLHRILDGLVRKGFVRLLHRDNRGTALRVYLPREVNGGGHLLQPAVFAPPRRAEVQEGSPRASTPARPAAHASVTACATAPVAPCAAPAAPSSQAPGAIPLGDARTRSLAAALAAARGASGGEGLAEALREVSGLVADGATPRQIEAAIRAVARRRAERGGSP